jgi:hypothetical protein
MIKMFTTQKQLKEFLRKKNIVRDKKDENLFDSIVTLTAFQKVEAFGEKFSRSLISFQNLIYEKGNDALSHLERISNVEDSLWRVLLAETLLSMLNGFQIVGGTTGLKEISSSLEKEQMNGD